MYFQAAYMNDDFWKISCNMSGFVKANLTFGLIYEAKTQVGLDERGTDGRNFPKIAINIRSLEIHFGCPFFISDTIRAIFWTYMLKFDDI